MKFKLISKIWRKEDVEEQLPLPQKCHIVNKWSDTLLCVRVFNEELSTIITKKENKEV